MKKLICCLLVCAFAFANISSIHAANTSGAETVITTEVQPSYTITIPKALEIPYGSTKAKPFMITASNVLLEQGKKVSVRAVGSGTDGAFTMDNGTNTLGYELSRVVTPWSAVPKNYEVASFTSDGMQSIYAKVSNWKVPTAGTYSGTITFTVTYQNQ